MLKKVFGRLVLHRDNHPTDSFGVAETKYLRREESIDCSGFVSESWRYRDNVRDAVLFEQVLVVNGFLTAKPKTRNNLLHLFSPDPAERFYCIYIERYI